MPIKEEKEEEFMDSELNAENRKRVRDQTERMYTEADR